MKQLKTIVAGLFAFTSVQAGEMSIVQCKHLSV